MRGRERDGGRLPRFEVQVERGAAAGLQLNHAEDPWGGSGVPAFRRLLNCRVSVDWICVAQHSRKKLIAHLKTARERERGGERGNEPRKFSLRVRSGLTRGPSAGRKWHRCSTIGVVTLCASGLAGWKKQVSAGKRKVHQCEGCGRTWCRSMPGTMSLPANHPHRPDSGGTSTLTSHWTPASVIPICLQQP